MNDHAHRGTLFLEQAEVLDHQAWPGDQYVLRLEAPECAARARPGSFVHLTCDEQLPMRRPLSLLRVGREAGWIEVLFKVVGRGTELLARRRPGDRLSVLGPVGRPFAPDPARPRALLLGGGVGIPPMIFLAETLREEAGAQPFLVMGSEVPFPFAPRPSRLLVPGMPDGVIAAMPLMEDWGIPSRLTSLQGFPGCFEGYLTDLARHWLEALDERQRDEVAVYACGPHPMLEATARLARSYGLPCQVSLEEFMACAVGGCAGCTVPVEIDGRRAMKRVCVDGPVFPAEQVFPAMWTVASGE